MAAKASRSPWEQGFPPVFIHAPRLEVTTHPWFVAARTGDVDAAALLVADTLSGEVTDRLAQLGEGKNPILAAVHARKLEGLSVVGAVLASGLQQLLGWEMDTELVQANIVDHHGDIGISRLACQAVFDGFVQAGRAYVLVDDFIGLGGTMANLRGHILRHGGQVLGATVLTGKPAAAALVPDAATLLEARSKHGSIESWWRDQFGFGFDCLTAAEAGFVVGNKDSADLRARIEALGCA
ncbi:phosphoribosyltransferase [Massilia horti]|uniref:Phosphoribosyltransferase n=1 Tax=Massilia horti TaxID=2562153 RepID=A0A4Y9SS91_9BURK|nr:phosphoribosyltransferase [Massilia horti]TFW27523.1 phosphoribosyltransferase [Massilia horti]